MATKKRGAPVPFPTREQILEFVKDSRGRISKREIARAFKIRGQDKITLKKTLRQMADEGLIASDPGRRLRPAGELPPVTLVEITGVDEYGDLSARPQNWSGEADPPRIFITPTRRRKLPALGPGNSALVRLKRMQDKDGAFYSAEIIRVLEAASRTVLGVYHATPQPGGGGMLTATDKKIRHAFKVAKGDDGSCRDGELVLAEVLKQGRDRSAARRVRVTERLGDMTEPRSVSLIAIHHHGIPTDFPTEALTEAEQARPVKLGKLTDLRHIPLVTIDPASARDHDDAIYAERSTNAKNEGGWELMIAIADVAHYVAPGSALDKEARKRGNSCYFPDRHVPMLPDVLSGGLCSLHVGEDRASLVCHITIDKNGRMLRHRFERALIRSAASLTYHDAQAAIDGRPTGAAGEFLEPVLKPLYGAFHALMRARKAREPLDLDLPERRIVLGDDGHIESIERVERLDAHRVVEEFMVAANVAAAEALETKRTPCMYRVHEPPGFDKIEALQEFLESLDLKLTRSEVLRPRLFNRILAQAKKTDFSELVADVVLRSQTQAYYSPANLGHFGLALARYAHFTSPIRRYSDLIVHRALIRALGLPGKDGLTDAEISELPQIGEDISATERRAMAAERDSTDRYLAAFLAEQVDSVFSGRISGVQRFGLFVSLDPSGADGLIPVSTIGDDYYDYDEAHHRLTGRASGRSYQLGQRVEVRLVEADRYTGGLRLELLNTEPAAGGSTRSKRRPKGGNQRSRRGQKRRAKN